MAVALRLAQDFQQVRLRYHGSEGREKFRTVEVLDQTLTFFDEKNASADELTHPAQVFQKSRDLQRTPLLSP